MSLLQSLQLSDNRTIGIMMISLGSFFFFIGVVMIFDRGLMALGNLLFLGGFPFLIGFQTTLAFFNPIRHPAKRVPVLLFFIGVILIFFFRYTFIGFAVEVYISFFICGAKLFGSVFANIVPYLKQLPGLNIICAIPFISQCVEQFSGVSKKDEGDPV